MAASCSRFAALPARAATLAGVALAGGHFLLSAAALVPAGRAAAALVALVAAGCAAMAFSRRGPRLGLYLLGFSLFLFGAQAYVYPAVVFGLVIDGVALALLWRNAGRDAQGSTGLSGVLLAALAALALASTWLLPWDRFFAELRLFGPRAFFAAMAFSPADAPAYSLACAWRLAVFAVFARELARLKLSGKFAILLRGLAGGLLTAVAFGLYEHFQGDHYLLHYRFTSLFANPGWFAEYASIAAPYLLLPLSRRDGARHRVMAAAALALVGAALVLTLARAGWIVGALTYAAAAWLYFRPGPLARFSRPYGHLPTLVAAGVLFLGVSFWASGKELAAISRPINALLAERVGNFTESPRPGLFRAGLCIAAERPLFGMGFETYARHYPVLLATPGAWLHRFGDPRAEVFETSHNMYVQLASGLGAAGLCLWLALAGRAGLLLWRRARAFGSLADAAMLLSLVAFHLYAVFQEMFYVPAVWFLLFVPLARAMALEAQAAGRDSRAARLVGWAAFALVAAGASSYATDAGLRATAARLHLADWRPAGQELAFEGFYPAEAGADGGLFRWSAGVGTLLVAPGTDAVTLSLAAPQPASVAVYSDVGLVGAAQLDARPQRLRVVLPPGGDGRGKPLYLLPDRTYLPQAVTGAPDPRRLGLSVGVAP